MRIPYPRELPDERLERRRRDPLRWLDRALALVLFAWIASFSIYIDETGWLSGFDLLVLAIGSILPALIFRSGRWGMFVAMMLVIPHLAMFFFAMMNGYGGPYRERLEMYPSLFLYAGPYIVIRTIWLWLLHDIEDAPRHDR